MPKLTSKNIETEVFKLIGEYSSSENLSVNRDMRFDDASVSSLDVLQIIFRLEESHGIEIDTAAFDEVQTIGDIVEYVIKEIRTF